MTDEVRPAFRTRRSHGGRFEPDGAATGTGVGRLRHRPSDGVETGHAIHSASGEARDAVNASPGEARDARHGRAAGLDGRDPGIAECG
jgi:hypothetical protein